MKAAVESIRFLISQAYIDPLNPISEKQAELARRIALKFRIRQPYELKLLFCKKCKEYSPPVYFKTVRVRGGKIIFKCKKCGSVYRIPFK